MKAPSGVILAWPSTVASIPAGWTRATAIDDRYPHVATGDTAGTTGGAASHSHEATASHGHTLGSHNHGISAGQGSGSIQRANASGYTPATTAHTHGNSNSATATDTITARAVTSDVASNVLPTMRVIWIVSDGTTAIPAGAYAYFDRSTLPTGWTQPTGTYSPVGNFLRGALADADGGSFQNGGFTTHVHTDTHNHLTDGHVHAAANSAVNTGTATNLVDLATTGYARDGHHHPVSLGSKVDTLGNGTESLSAEDGYPKWEKLLVIENSTGGPDTPAGVIGLWLGSIASIPAGWTVRSSTQDFLLSAANSGEIGATGGATTHNHDDTPHTHTFAVHKHTSITAGNADSVCYAAAGSGGTRSTTGHTHTWTVANSSAESVSTETISWTACASKAAYPPYIEVILIRAPVDGAAASTGAGLLGSALGGFFRAAASVAKGVGLLGAATAGVIRGCAAVCTGTGLCAAAAGLILLGAASSTGVGLTTAGGQVARGAAASSTGSGLTTASGAMEYAGAASATGVGQGTGTGNATLGGQASLAGIGYCSASGTVQTPSTLYGASSATGRGLLALAQPWALPLAIHSGSRSVWYRDIGVRAVTARHSAAAAVMDHDAAVRGARRKV
jgi:hypothetical protein